MKTTELLYDLSNKLLALMSMAKANALLREDPVFKDIEELQQRTGDLWRELMKSQS